MRRRHLTPLGVAAVLMLGPVRVVGAQSAASPGTSAAGTRRPATPVATAEPNVTAKHSTSAVVVVPVTTSELTLVSVPLPPAFANHEKVSYTATSLRLGAVVGQLAGFIAPGDPPRRAACPAPR